MILRRGKPSAAGEEKPKGFDDFELRLGDVMRGERATLGKSLLDVQRELKIKATYIDTGKVRYVFREFPLDIKAAAGSMLSRCIAKDDSGKYFAVTDMLFRQQGDWVMKNTTETLTRIGKQAGLSQQQVEDCLKDQALLDKIVADQKYASEVLKVDSTPTFFINGEKIKGETSFEEFDKRIKSLLKS
ncbi:hypothetical protein GALL_514270 [mine drainage metagenome]|uniref:Thioredoxin-like fold domain-containing protein n=1 Tax=mine drainage metagenome TaxID=410659 RepID=A0A1J5P8D4_9ZZZZ